MSKGSSLTRVEQWVQTGGYIQEILRLRPVYDGAPLRMTRHRQGFGGQEEVAALLRGKT